MIRSPEEMKEFLRDNVYLTDEGCREWAGSIQDNGHPRIIWAGKTYYVRRLILQLNGRRMKSTDKVWTKCCNHKCVAIDHIERGTHAQMMKAMGERNVLSNGAARVFNTARALSKNAKLSVINDAQDLFQMRLDGKTYTEIAKVYGVSRSAVFAVVKRATNMGLMGRML